MFEQENLQGWNVSHIVSSWHRGLGKGNAAMAPREAFKHGVETSPGRWQGWGEEDPQILADNDALVCLSQKTFMEENECLWAGAFLAVFPI